MNVKQPQEKFPVKLCDFEVTAVRFRLIRADKSLYVIEKDDGLNAMERQQWKEVMRVYPTSENTFGISHSEAIGYEPDDLFKALLLRLVDFIALDKMWSEKFKEEDKKHLKDRRIW